MATLTITIPDDNLKDLQTAAATLWPIPTDEYGVPLYSAEKWLPLKVQDFVREMYRSWTVNTALAAARATATASVNSAEVTANEQAATDTAGFTVA